MAIVNSVATYTGQGSQLSQNIAVAITVAASPQTVTVPKTGSFSPAVTRGMWRCKFYAMTSALTFNSVNIQATDGTNTVTVDAFVPVAVISITSTAYVDVSGEFIIDSPTTGSGTVGGLTFGGATVINFIVVTATGSGACSGDFEVSAEP